MTEGKSPPRMPTLFGPSVHPELMTGHQCNPPYPPHQLLFPPTPQPTSLPAQRGWAGPNLPDPDLLPPRCAASRPLSRCGEPHQQRGPARGPPAGRQSPGAHVHKRRARGGRGGLRPGSTARPATSSAPHDETDPNPGGLDTQHGGGPPQLTTND